MYRDFQIFLRPNPNAQPIEINSLLTLENFVKVLSITVLGVEGQPEIKYTCIPGRGEVLNPIRNNLPFINFDTFRGHLDLEIQMPSLVLYPTESNVCGFFI